MIGRATPRLLPVCTIRTPGTSAIARNISFSQSVIPFDLFSDMSGNTRMDFAEDVENVEGVEYEEYNDEEEDVEEVEEVEEDVTDEEEEPTANAGSSNTGSPSVAKDTTTPVKGGKPGKVNPSPQVRNMSMGTPGSKDTRKAELRPDRNPFPTFGAWTPKQLSQVDIVFPILTGKNESTNELTRSNKPEGRFWKAPIIFKFGNFTSETLRFDNVHVPFHTNSGYGSNYVYLCLPGFAAEMFADAGKLRAPTIVAEKSLVPDPERWWKIANNVQGSFGIVRQTSKRFIPISLESILNTSNAGITCSVILNFKCKASTDEREALRSTTARTVAVEVVRAFICETDVNVQMPVRVSREKPKVVPSASSSDIATDDLMKRLSELGV